MAEHVLSGDQLAWALIADQEPGMLCKRAQARHDFVANKFTVLSFGQEIRQTTKFQAILLQGNCFCMDSVIFLTWQYFGIWAGQKICRFPVG